LKWLKRAGTLLLCVLVLVGVAAAGGLAIPEDHYAISSIELATQPDEVFARISDVARGAEWRPSVERVELLETVSGQQRFREHGTTGPLTMEIVEIAPPRRLVTRIADADLPFGGTWSWDIEPTAGGSRVTIEERGEIYNPIFRLVSRFAIGYNATMETYLLDLAASFDQPTATVTSSWSH